MNKWKDESRTRPLFEHDGKWFTFKSDHVLEERTIELTDDYRDENGDFIWPEPIEWDGVQTSPGVKIKTPDGERAL